jgi:hypothetical protein
MKGGQFSSESKQNHRHSNETAEKSRHVEEEPSKSYKMTLE